MLIPQRLCLTCNAPTDFKCGYCLRCISAAAQKIIDDRAIERMLDDAEVYREQDDQVRRTTAATIRRMPELRAGGVG